MKAILLLFLFLLPGIPYAQKPLSSSTRTSPKRYIYKITSGEALVLYKTKLNDVNEEYLHSLVDSANIDHSLPVLNEGNYLILHANGNKQHYELKAIGDLQIKTVNNRKDLAIALHRKDGNVIRNAVVKMGRRHIRFDEQTQSYRQGKIPNQKAIVVTHNNTTFYFPIEKRSGRPTPLYTLKRKIINGFPLKYITKAIERWQGYSPYVNYFERPVPHEDKFRGFMTFSKPIYKPGDTVRIKAFVMNRNGKGLNKNLLLRLTDREFINDTIIAVLKPYRAGGFTHEFVLNDSLDLDLDEKYLLTLEEERSRKYNLNNYQGNLDEDEYAAKRKVVMRGKFDYEEYELQNISFSVRADKKEHNRGNNLSIYLRATDENDLPIMDGQLQITLIPNMSTIKSYNAPALFIPDTVWTHTQQLETVGETKVVLPDSLFPAASFDYRIECVLLNSNNERQTQQLQASYKYEDEIISFELKQDSLHIDYTSKGRTSNVEGIIYAFNNNKDTLLTTASTLPTAIKINPYVTYYEVHAAGSSKPYYLKQTAGMVSALATRTSDSVFIALQNPHRLPVWYTVFAGNRIVTRGMGDSLMLTMRSVTSKNYFVSLQYVFGNKIYHEEYTVVFRDKLLNISVNMPRMVFPGQTSTLEVGVTDAAGKKIEGADVTAYAFTQKFRNINSPYIPYLGKTYPARKLKPTLTTVAPKDWIAEHRLNWKRWSLEMNLDTIEYYKFLYTDSIYRNSEKTKDGITQIAPFVVIKGELQPIHLLYIDEKPYYFSKSKHLTRYSFPVTAGKHSLRIRTHNRTITLKEIEIPKGIKTIISINGDTSNSWVSVRNEPDTLTKQERILLEKYTLLMTNSYGERLNYIEQDNNIFMLPKLQYQGQQASLIGPLLPNTANLVVHDYYRQPFDVEGGYLYHIEKGLIKQKQVNIQNAISKWLPGETGSINFSDFVLTEYEIDSLWISYLEHRSANEDLFINSNIKKPGNGALRIEMERADKGNSLFVKNLLLFRKDNTDFLHIYRGGIRDLGFLEPGSYQLLILLKDDNYIIRDSIVIQKDGLNFYKIQTNNIKPSDSISKRMAAIIQKRELSNRHNSIDLDAIRESLNNGFLDATTFNNTIFGQVRDAEGKPLPFVSVNVKGTRVVTQTDENGFYKLNGPAKGTLVFSSIGFSHMEQPINSNQIDVALHAVNNSLEEVVVVGYGAQRKSAFTSSIAVVNELQGKAPGIMIRGTSSITGATAPLIVIDGIPYAGTVEDIDPGLLSGITVLKPDVAQALYGARGMNGVLLITTKGGSADPLNGNDVQHSSTNTIRRNFRDHAYWQPKLRTDKEGKVKFTTTFPDDITNWKAFFLAIGSQKHSGYYEGMIRSFKPVSANLSLPPFAIEGDYLNVIGKTLNYGNDTLQIRRKISINDSMYKDGMLSFHNSYIDTINLSIKNEDTMTLRLELNKDDGYYDGEERKIPVFRQGVLETKGFFAALEGDTTIKLQMDPSLGKVTLFAEASLMPILLEETEKIYRYEYLCNEQLASKLKALLMQKKITLSLGERFKKEHVIVDIISKLNNKRTGNLWGWWANNEWAPWISLHAVEALLMAEKEGYKVALPKASMIDFLVYNMEQSSGREKLLTLTLLHQLDAKVDYTTYIDSLERQLKEPTLYQRLRLAELKQKTGGAVEVGKLLSQSKHTMFGNMYWGEEGFEFFDNAIQNTVLMYRLLRASGTHETTLVKIRNYFLEKRKDGQWRNTYESSLILETILPDLLKGKESIKPATLTFSDNPGEVISIFPFQKELQEGSLVSVNKSGDFPVYFTAYQQYWNKKPEAVSAAFTVNTTFNTSNRTITTLKAGEPVILNINVTVKGDADYVMIEIPIPAGCSYKEKPQPKWNNEVHREYFKEKVSIFCSSLKQGTYTFSFPLLPRYTGTYHLNPAKAEMMYFPVFYGREGIKQISVK
jgi:alpha-2-macroglobulin